MKTVFNGFIAVRVIGGEDQEYPARFHLNYTAGRPEYYDKSVGTWLPPDPPEIEVQSAQVNIEDKWLDLPQWFVNGVQDEQETLYHFDEFIADEINRGPED